MLKNFNPVHFPKYDGVIALFLGQDFSHKLSPKQPPETALPESAAQELPFSRVVPFSKLQGAACLRVPL